MNVCEQGDTNS